MNNPYRQLTELFKRLSHLEHALTFLQWDQLVKMPPGGAPARAEAIAELTALHHATLVAPETGDLINEAKQSDLPPDQQISLREMEWDYRTAVCLPADLVKAKSLAGSRCEQGWRQQRKENDWPGFLKNFQEVVALGREEARIRQASTPDRFATPYDALLDLYCRGDTSSLISSIFTMLEHELVPLLHRVVDHQKARTYELDAHYPETQQFALSKKLMALLGFDFSSGRVDESLHPFSTGGRGDHRITTRFRETDFLDALKATAHETGHASYESGLPAAWDGLPVGRACNLCIHESQSLLFEKQIFLSQAFVRAFTTEIHAHLPTTRPFDATRIWQLATRVRPSYIRVEADEVSYPLHIIVRYTIETELINGQLEASQIPTYWDELMRRYLNLSTAGNDGDGCLQDIHWTDGTFGYFPAYTMGSLNGAQLFNAIATAHPDWQQRFAHGDIDFVRSWLSEHVWSKGRTLGSQDIMTTATGEGTNPAYFLKYLQDRYIDERY